MICHCFITRNDREFLARHIEIYGRLADQIVAVVDRDPESAAICRRMGVEVIEWNRGPRDDWNENGLVMDEGAMRQAAWDAAMSTQPELILLGDTDEWPTADAAEWIRSRDRSVEVWCADWVNLYGDPLHAIGGNSEWSFQKKTNNKKGFAVRPVPGREYRYRIADQHVRMEPSPRAGPFDETHRLLEFPKLLHWKYCSRGWIEHPMRNLPRYAGMRAAEIVPIPAGWHWTTQHESDHSLAGSEPL